MQKMQGFPTWQIEDRGQKLKEWQGWSRGYLDLVKHLRFLLIPLFYFVPSLLSRSAFMFPSVSFCDSCFMFVSSPCFGISLSLSICLMKASLNNTDCHWRLEVGRLTGLCTHTHTHTHTHTETLIYHIQRRGNKYRKTNEGHSKSWGIEWQKERREK